MFPSCRLSPNLVMSKHQNHSCIAPCICVLTEHVPNEQSMCVYAVLLLLLLLLPDLCWCQSPTVPRLWVIDPWIVPPDPAGRPYPPVTACSRDQIRFTWSAPQGPHGLFKMSSARLPAQVFLTGSGRTMSDRCNGVCSYWMSCCSELSGGAT